jgi:hypothetical protein
MERSEIRVLYWCHDERPMKKFRSISAQRTHRYLTERAARGDIAKALGILKRAGVGNPPRGGDKLRRAKKRA